MPQMFPLVWLALFISINVSLIIMVNIIHFLLKPTNKNSMGSMNNPSNYHTWKW